MTKEEFKNITWVCREGVRRPAISRGWAMQGQGEHPPPPPPGSRGLPKRLAGAGEAGMGDEHLEMGLPEIEENQAGAFLRHPGT